jgi:hypothetical protein
LVSRFIMKMMSLLNTQVAKNWARFDNFFDLLYSFGCSSNTEETDEAKAAEPNYIGLEYLLSQRFVERSCDFMLGKKSPLCGPGEKRFEMGSSYNGPNFTPLIRLLTKVFVDESFLIKYPLNEVEKRMFLHADLLKVMLSTQSVAK